MRGSVFANFRPMSFMGGPMVRLITAICDKSVSYVHVNGLRISGFYSSSFIVGIKIMHAERADDAPACSDCHIFLCAL